MWILSLLMNSLYISELKLTSSNFFVLGCNGMMISSSFDNLSNVLTIEFSLSGSSVLLFLWIVECGAAIITDADEEKIVNGYYHFKDNKISEYPELFGDGKAAEFICNELISNK